MVIDLSFLKQLDRFSIVLKKRVISNYAGSRESQMHGTGLVFYDYKDYVPGDDFRAIDWKVFARTDEFFIRRYEEERNMHIHVVIDASASMDFGSGVKKFEYASMIGLGFCYMALKNNESFEVSTFSEDLEVFRPAKGVNKLASILDTLNNIKPKGNSRFKESLAKYKKAIKSKALVIIISDMLFNPEQLRDTLYRFKKSDVLIVQVLDADERQLDLEGDTVLEDAESKAELRTFISNKVIENYSEELLDHIYRIKGICDTFNAKFLSVSTETPVFDAFFNLLTDSDQLIM